MLSPILGFPSGSIAVHWPLSRRIWRANSELSRQFLFLMHFSALPRMIHCGKRLVSTTIVYVFESKYIGQYFAGELDEALGFNLLIYIWTKLSIGRCLFLLCFSRRFFEFWKSIYNIGWNLHTLIAKKAKRNFSAPRLNKFSQIQSTFFHFIRLPQRQNDNLTLW